MKLEQIWQKVNEILNSAYALLPQPMVKNEEYWNADLDFKSFMEHNELELALDALESLGEANKVPLLFWERLMEAAGIMGLNERKNRLRHLYRRHGDDSPICESD